MQSATHKLRCFSKKPDLLNSAYSFNILFHCLFNIASSLFECTYRDGKYAQTVRLKFFNFVYWEYAV